MGPHESIRKLIVCLVVVEVCVCVCGGGGGGGGGGAASFLTLSVHVRGSYSSHPVCLSHSDFGDY